MENQKAMIEESVEKPEKLDSLKQINCQVDALSEESKSPKHEASSPSRTRNDGSTGTKTKRKSRSTRRRLNAMMNNSSLHFSDTDSEGELTLLSSQVRNLSPNKSYRKTSTSEDASQNPIISVTLDEDGTSKIEDLPWQGFGEIRTPSRRNSFVENLTDVDEIYTSDPEIDVNKSDKKSLVVVDNTHQGETDYEDFSNDEEDEPPTPIYVLPRTDILYDFTGGTITTKEGDGPFSIEVRNQMSFDQGSDTKEINDTPDIVIMPTTDSEDMDASDEEDQQEGACGQREMLEDFDLLAASQIVMKNINKMENSLSVKDISDNDISDSHTDIEDIE